MTTLAATPMRRMLLTIGILALVLWVYWPAHRAGFIWLDKTQLHDAAQSLGSGLTALLHGLGGWNNYFRPVGVALLAIERQWFGMDPAAMHWVSLALHLVNTLLVGMLARRFAQSGGGALTDARSSGLAMLVYGLHPALIEPVVWISAQFDLAVTFFILLAMVLNESVQRLALRAAAVGACFLLAAGCKESAIALPVLIVLQDWLHERCTTMTRESILLRIWQRQRVVYAALLAAGIIYLALRYRVMGHLLQISSGAAPSIMERMQTACSLLMIYWRVLFWPMIDQGPLHDIDVAKLASFGSIAALQDLAVAIVLVCAMVLLRRFRLVGALVLAPTIALLPVLHIIPVDFDSSPYHERYATAATALAAALLPAAWADLRLSPARARMAAVAGVTILLLWIAGSVLSIRTTLPLWSDETKLWLWSSQTHPDSVLAKNHLLAAYLAKDDRADARPIAAQLLTGRLPCPVCMVNVARLALSDGDIDTARRALDRVRHLMPLMQQSRLQQLFAMSDGDIHDRQGDSARAEADYRRAIDLAPLDGEAHMRLALLLARRGQNEPAQAEAQRALALFDPDERDAQSALFRKALATPFPQAPAPPGPPHG